MELEKELLSKFGNRRPFKLPDGYFDSLEMRVMSQIASENTKTSIEKQCSHKNRAIFNKRLCPLMIAASFVGIMLIGAVAMHFFKNERNEATAQRNNVSTHTTISTTKENSDNTEYLEEAAEYMMLDNDDVYAYLADN